MASIDRFYFYNPEIPGLSWPDGGDVEFGWHRSCPLALGDIVNNRFRILALLGVGGHALVWLAEDQSQLIPRTPTTSSAPLGRTPRYVVLKVSDGGDEQPDEQHMSSEAAILSRLQRADGPGEHSIVKMFDAFIITSANGVHQCLVLELAGQSLAIMLADENVHLPFHGMIHFFRECVGAVERIYSYNTCHGDLDVGNFVEALPDFSALSEAELLAKLSDDPTLAVGTAKMRDGTPLPPSIPATVCPPHSFRGLAPDKNTVFEDVHLKLIDFGEAFEGTKRGVLTHTRNTPPELLDDNDGGLATSSSNVWALGCILFHLVCGQPHRRFILKSMEQRRAMISKELERAEFAPEGEILDAVLEVLLAALEPDPDLRPSAQNLLSFRPFYIPKKILKGDKFESGKYMMSVALVHHSPSSSSALPSNPQPENLASDGLEETSGGDGSVIPRK